MHSTEVAHERLNLYSVIKSNWDSVRFKASPERGSFCLAIELNLSEAGQTSLLLGIPTCDGTSDPYESVVVSTETQCRLWRALAAKRTFEGWPAVESELCFGGP